MTVLPGAGDRILVSRLRYLGDAILSLPLLQALASRLPDCELHYLAEEPNIRLLEGQPEIAVRWVAPRGMGRTLRLVRALRQQRFAAAIDLFCNPRSALLIGACGAPVRIGEDRRGRRHAYSVARRLVPGKSALEQHLDALRPLGLEPPPPSRPVLRLRDAERAAGAALWSRLASQPGVLLHVAATQPAKEWPIESAAALCRELWRDGLPVALSSSPRRPEPSAALAQAAGSAARLVAPLGLREWLGFASAAAAVVTVDGALTHAAVALGRPTVALFGPTDPKIWFPYTAFGPYRVLHAGLDCSSCDRSLCPEHRCMAALRPEAVRQALQEVLAAPASAA
jgi:ADP-heptose:LPS heptosyltransferase